MQLLMEHARRFGERAEEFRQLADGQAPQALFLTCSDSRVIPSLFTGAGPGELFELRTAGGIVPAYDAERYSGEAATIEYAVQVLPCPDPDRAAARLSVRGGPRRGPSAADPRWCYEVHTGRVTARRAGQDVFGPL